eukprot:1393419-Rhodomonas_salina.1
MVVLVAVQILEPPAARLLEDSPAASLLEELSRVEGRRARAAARREATYRWGENVARVGAEMGLWGEFLCWGGAVLCIQEDKGPGVVSAIKRRQPRAWG